MIWPPVTDEERRQIAQLTQVFSDQAKHLGGVEFQPSPKQFFEWRRRYGFGVVEQGIVRGLRCFLRNKGPVRTDAQAVYMLNYLNTVMKDINSKIERVPAPDL